MADGIGLYIGTHSLDLVQVTGGFQHPRIVKLGSAVLDAPIPSDDPSGIQALAKPLTQLLQEAKLANPELHVGIAPEAAIIRYFQMQKLPMGDRAMAIRFEAKKYLPFKLEELLSDSQIVIAKNDPNVMRVMFYAAKKELLQQYLELFTQAGVRVRSLETGLGGLTRILRQNRQLEPGKTAVILIIDRETASIGIVRNELVYLARNVTVVPPAISPEGAAVRQDVPATSAPEEVPGARSPDIFDALLNEASVSIDYYRRRFAGEPPVSKILISADTVPGQWTQELTTNLELPAEPLEPGRAALPGQRLAGNLAIAYGLALRPLETGRQAINLLPQELKPRSTGFLKVVAAEIGGAVLALALLYQLKAQPLRRLSSELFSLQQATAASAGLAPGDLTLERLEAIRTERKAELQFLKNVSAIQMPMASTLGRLASLTPESVWIRQLLLTDAIQILGLKEPVKNQRNLTLAGSAYHPAKAQELDAINTYVTALNNEPAIARPLGTINLTGMSRSKAQQVEVTDFQLVSQRSGREL